jgi:hypothetical protein
MSCNESSSRTSSALENWLAILDSYGAQFLILDKRRDGEFLQLVQSHPGWTVDFEGSDSILFARGRPPNRNPAAV